MRYLLAIAGAAALFAQREIPKPDDDGGQRTEQAVPRGGRKAPVRMGVLTGPYGMLELNRCWHEGSKITCRFTFTSDRPRATSFRARALFNHNSIVDNLQREHSLAQSYFLDRAERLMATVNLTKDESVTFIQEFAGDSGEIHTIRLVAPRTTGEIRDVRVQAQ